MDQVTILNKQKRYYSYQNYLFKTKNHSFIKLNYKDFYFLFKIN